MVKRLIEIIYNREFNVANPVSIFESLFGRDLSEHKLKDLIENTFGIKFANKALTLTSKTILLPRDVDDMLELVFEILL